MKARRWNRYIWAMIAALLLASTAGADTWYVDDSNTAGPHDGTTWASAYQYLQDALDIAVEEDVIKVGQGAYYPDEATEGHTEDNRSEDFDFSGVELYGGYAGYNAPEPDERDIDQYVTILSGDIDQNDGPGVFENNDDNSYHVVTANAAGVAPVLDGFTITAGNADGSGSTNYGGGMYSGPHSAAILVDCTIIENSADYYGGGLYINTSNNSVVLVNCAFHNNSAYMGGGIFDTSINAKMTDCLFSGNTGTRGAALCAYGDSNPLVSNCVFSGNSASQYGGAMYCYYQCNPTITNCLFTGNWASTHGGGMYNTGAGTNPTLTNCTLSDNSAGSLGGGIYNGGNELTVANSILWGNRDSGDPDETAQIEGGTVIIDYSCVEGWTGGLGGTGNIGVDPGFVVGPSGTWSAPAVYDPVTARTTFTDAVAAWEEGAWVGGFINPDTTQTLQLAIDTNSATTITVMGDFASLGEVGFAYQVVDDHLGTDSPCIDAADNTAVPADEADLDGDEDTTERVPLDLDGVSRFFDDPDTIDTGEDDLPDYPAVVDMGVYEFGSTACDCPGDVDGNGAITGLDIMGFVDCAVGAGSGFACSCGDFNGSGGVDAADVEAFVAAVLAGGSCP